MLAGETTVTLPKQTFSLPGSFDAIILIVLILVGLSSLTLVTNSYIVGDS